MMINLKKVWNDNPFDQWTEEELLCMEGQGICYGKGGGSAPPPPAVQTTTQTSEFPTELRPFISDIFEKGQAVQEQRQEEGFQPELTQQLAPFTPDQQAAFEGIREQVGQTRPLFDEATTLARGATRGATDPTEIAALMNPFLRNVVDIEKREAERVADVQEQQLGARAAQAGAFGGSRAAVLEAERQRNLNQQLGDIESRGLATAFQDAQNRLQSQFGREAAGATQLSALGTAIPAQVFKELGALSGVGAAEQQQGQRALDIATQQAREEFGFPQQTLQDFSSILRGFPLPPTTNVSRQTFSPAQPLSTQLLGLGTGLAGLAGAAGAFKKAGGRVGAPAPVALKNGGYVKLAGGGGLGEMMQGEVQRYQEGGGFSDRRLEMDTTTLEEYLQRLDPESRKAVLDLVIRQTQGGSPEEQDRRRLTLLKGPASDVIPTPRKKPTRGVAGDVATESIQNAGLRPIDMIEGPGGPPSFVKASYKDPNDLSFVQKAFGVVDDIAMGRGPAQPATVSLDPKMGVKVPEEQAQTVTTSLPPAQPQLLSGQTLDPGGAGALPGPGLIESIREEYPYKIPPRVDRSATSAGPIPSSELRSNAPLGDFSSAEGYTEAGRKALEKYNVPFERRGDRPELGDKPVPTMTQVFGPGKLGFSLDTLQSVQETIGGTPEGRNPLQRLASTIGLDAGIADSVRRYGIVGDAAGRLGGSLVDAGRDMFTLPNLMSVPDASVIAERNRLIAEGKENPTSAPMGDPNVGQSKKFAEAQERERARKSLAEQTQPDLDVDKQGTSIEELEKIQVTEKGPDGLTGEIVDADISLTEGSKGAPDRQRTAILQQDYDQQVAALKGRDYSDKVEKMLGKAPTYEKGEAPDVSAQMYLALAKVGFEIASAPSIDKDGRPQNLGTIFGKAAKEGIKDVTGILKEKNKIEKELRKERNTQKRADYEDKLKRLNVQENLRKADMDILKTAADIKLKEERNEISREDAETRRRQEISRSALNSTRASILALERKQAEDGTVLIKDIMSELSKLRQLALKSNLNSMVGVNTKTSTAAYNEQLPLIFEQYRGRVVRNGKPISDAELASILRISPSTGGEGIGGRTINRPDGATVKVN